MFLVNRRMAAALVLVVMAGCGRDGVVGPPERDMAQVPTTVADPPLTATTEPATDTRSPQFAASVRPIDGAAAARITASWRPGCPVALGDLRLVMATHWGFDGQPRQGQLVVHTDHAEDAVSVFKALFAARFPIQQMRLIDEFGADDDRSMAANNTSGFNCRPTTGSDRWSEHAYGRAIDINPVQNPFVTRSGDVLPPAGEAYTGRVASTTGLITADGPVVKAFSAAGWRWGGSWSPGRDYQHFSVTGR